MKAHRINYLNWNADKDLTFVTCHTFIKEQGKEVSERSAVEEGNLCSKI